MSTRTVPPSRLGWLAAGFAVWCSALVMLYALHALGCAFAWPTAALRLCLVLVLGAHLIVIGRMWWTCARADPDPALGEPATFLRAVIVWTTIAAFVATVLTLGPPLALQSCV